MGKLPKRLVLAQALPDQKNPAFRRDFGSVLEDLAVSALVRARSGMTLLALLLPGLLLVGLFDAGLLLLAGLLARSGLLLVLIRHVCLLRP